MLLFLHKVFDQLRGMARMCVEDNHQGHPGIMSLIIVHPLLHKPQGGLLMNVLLLDPIMGTAQLRLGRSEHDHTPSRACRGNCLGVSKRAPTIAHFAEQRHDAFIVTQENAHNS